MCRMGQSVATERHCVVKYYYDVDTADTYINWHRLFTQRINTVSLHNFCVKRRKHLCIYTVYIYIYVYTPSLCTIFFWFKETVICTCVKCVCVKICSCVKCVCVNLDRYTLYTCTYLHIYVCIYIHISTWVYIYIYTHTNDNLDTYTPSLSMSDTGHAHVVQFTACR